MNVLIVPDKFKGSLTASEVIVAIESGLRRQQPGINLHHVVASDGGDGFLEAVAECRAGLEMVECRTCDPLGRSIVAEYGWDAENATAYVEMARASGMELLDVEERNPAVASTEGTGRLIVDAIKNGAKKSMSVWAVVRPMMADAESPRPSAIDSSMVSEKRSIQ